MKTIIAKTRKGQEYFYSKMFAFSVPKTSAKKICDIVNASGWKLEDGETWHVYEIADYELSYTYAAWQYFRIRKGVVYAGGM